MFRIEQDPNGILITTPRGYRAVTAVLFGNRHRFNAAIVAASGAAAGAHVLDIACGPGMLASAMADRVGPSGQVIGVDAAPEMVEYATARSRSANCRFEHGIAQALDFPDHSFDVVTCTFGMHHIPESQRDTAISEMCRVLRPGGQLLLADMTTTGSHGHLTRLLTRHLDPDELDVRRYADTLTLNGFRQISSSVIKPSTRILTATKPA